MAGRYARVVFAMAFTAGALFERRRILRLLLNEQRKMEASAKWHEKNPKANAKTWVGRVTRDSPMVSEAEYAALAISEARCLIRIRRRPS